MSMPREALPAGELDELRSALTLHQPHGMQVGTHTCSYCGGVWDSVPFGDGPGFIHGCIERLDAQLALAEVGQLPDSLIVPWPMVQPVPRFLSTDK
jgi:hypothetical protein